MLDSDIKSKLLEKINNLITEKNESELLKKEFIDWFNSGKPFDDNLNSSEKEILKKYPNLVIKKTICVNLYYTLKYNNNSNIVSSNIFYIEDRSLLEGDDINFYIFELKTYPAIFNLDYYYSCPVSNDNKEIIKEVYCKINHIIRVRKKYLDKITFIKRVLDSRDLTLTILKRDYPDLYNLLDNDKETKTVGI